MSGRLEEAVAKAVKGFPHRGELPGSGTRAKDGGGRIARIRDRHHTIARMVAREMPDERICYIMGMTPQSLDLLKDQTPAFQELVHYYKGRPDKIAVVEEYLDQKARIARLAQLEIHDRLIEEPEKVSLSELLRVTSDFDDRTGFSKQSVNVNVNLDLAARLEHQRRTRQRSLAGAGDGGGALSPPVPSADSAPPLLELSANPPSSSGTPEPVVSPPSPPARKPLLHDTIMAGRDRRFVPDVTEKIRRI